MSKFLPDVAYITTGKLDSNAAVEGGQYPFFTCAPTPSTIDSYAFDEDAVLLAGNNAQGNFHISRYNGKFNAYQRTYVITAKEGNNIDYIGYSIEIALAHLKKISQGSQTKFLTKQILDSFQIADISIEEQNKIADILKGIDGKIKVNDSTISTLEDLSKTLYDYYFLQFDFPDENNRPYKSSGGKMEYNAELGREIPAGWKVESLANFFENERNGEWGTEETTKTNQLEVTCIRGADFPAANGYELLRAPSRFISKKKADRIVQPGDMIIEISGGSPTQSTGRACYINEELLARISKPITTSNFCKIVSIREISYFYFVYMTWQRLYENDIFFNFEGKTTGLKNLLFDVVTTSIKVACPPEDIVKQYQKIANNNFSRIQKLAGENRQLTALRDFLLPLLMNGQVTFRS